MAWKQEKCTISLSGSQNSVISFTGLKSMCWEAQAFSTGPWGERVPFYFQLLVAPIFLDCGCISTVSASVMTVGEEAFLCEVKFLSVSPYKDPYDCIFFILFYFLTLQYCTGFAIYQNESATGILVFLILNPLPSSLPIPSRWVVPLHQPQASSIVHRTWRIDALNCGVGEDSWESCRRDLRDCKGIQPFNPKGNQSWIIGRTDAEAETPILWPPDAKNQLIGKDPDAGKDWRWEEKGRTEDEMVGWHHRLNGHEFEYAPGVCDGQGSLACCSPWGHKELDTT